MQTLYEAAGGMKAIHRLADSWHKGAMAYEVVAPAFSEPVGNAQKC